MKKRLFAKEFDLTEFLAVALLFACVRQVLVTGLTIFPAPYAIHDDMLMVRGAWAMMQGGFGFWLGEYDERTLTKGFFFPFFLTVANKLGISYLAAAAGVYAFACIVFAVGISKLFRTKYPVYVSYLLLLFNPSAFSLNVLQRVYRNSLTPSQVLLIFGCFFAMYLRRREKKRKLLSWALGAGLSWASLAHTREDAVWVLPAALVILLVSAAAVWLDGRAAGERKGARFLKIAVFLCPALICWASYPAVASINEARYGLYTYNELSDSHFSDAMKAIYSVKMEGEDIFCVSVSRDKLRLLYEVSPSLAEIQDTLEPAMDLWTVNDRHPDDDQVEDGWFFWVLREAAAREGYHENPQKADAFYKNVAEEIQAAFADGRLTRQPVMPSALMPPWRKGYFGKLLSAMGETIRFVFSFDKNEPQVLAAEGPESSIALIEAATGNRAYYINTGEEMRWQDYSLAMLQVRCHRLVRFLKLYRKLGVPSGILGFGCWLLLTGTCVWMGIKKRCCEDGLLSIWLTTAGLWGAFICLIGGISYNHIASCNSILDVYLSGAYPLVIAACAMAAGYVLEQAVFRITRSRAKTG